MAHIAELMALPKVTAGLNNYIARACSPTVRDEIPSDSGTPTEREKYSWRLHQPSESRKYGLFPAKFASITGIKPTEDPSPSTSSTDKAVTTTKSKSKEQSLVRRRKISVPELGPMTTVQESAMDSPTIPGRPPAQHERSTSAPGGNDWLGGGRSERLLPSMQQTSSHEHSRSADTRFMSPREVPPFTIPTSNPPKRLVSPKNLSPLIIPFNNSAPPPMKLTKPASPTKSRSSSNPPEVPPKSARWLDNSPFPRSSPFTPSSNLGSTAPTSLSNTPVSAAEGRASPAPWVPASERNSPIPKPWMANFSIRSSPRSATATGSGSPNPNAMPNTMTTGRASPMAFANPISVPRCASASGHHHRQDSAASASTMPPVRSHQRHESEASMMNRGRPKKRNESSSPRKSHERSGGESCHSTSETVKAFESIPHGFSASQALRILPPSELGTLQAQAVFQAVQFRILSSNDVDALARELRGLDERCEYLRKTHRSLRAGRRNLHERICTFLRSPRTATFSHENLLKQQEAISELDASIDDWVTKLEHAENRRTRVRQKLLEHVAAAVVLNSRVAGGSLVRRGRDAEAENTPPRSPTEEVEVEAVTRDMKEEVEVEVEYAVSPVGATTPVDAPPESTSSVLPLPSSPQRQRSTRAVVHHVSRACSEKSGAGVESIRIYADSDVFALLADVEDEMNRMGDVEEEDEVEMEMDLAGSAHDHQSSTFDGDSSASTSGSVPLPPPDSPVFGIADCASMLRSVTTTTTTVEVETRV